MKEVEKPILDMAALRTKFIHSIAQEIRRRAAQLIPKRGKPLNLRPTVSPRFRILPSQSIEPLHNRGAPVRITEKDESCCWHRNAFLITILLYQVLPPPVKYGDRARAQVRARTH
jgi:hypothetical protein